MADCITRMFDKMDKETAEEDNITDMDAIKLQILEQERNRVGG